jgi:hypothetical protein
MDCQKLNERDLRALLIATEEIAKRTSYGIRKELAEEKSTILAWSNASKKWFVYGKVDKGEEVSLDANMILVPFSPGRAERIADCLPTLPLYYLSFEAQARGEVNPVEAAREWAKKQLERIELEKERKRWI